jgi:predicted nuclease of predicted toxin-antitoxin system
VKFKLDENLGPSIQNIFKEKGFDCSTVKEENLSGSNDQTLFHEVQKEGRVLVTMDYDFSNVLVYPPKSTHGIVVINTPGQPSLAFLKIMVKEFLNVLGKENLKGRLWIVEPGRIREHQSE